MQPLFSVRMRAAAGASHEAGGRHLSGAERLVEEDNVEETVLRLLQRARSRDVSPEFIRITVERVDTESLIRIPCLAVTTVAPQDPQEARAVAERLLRDASVEEPAIKAAFHGLRNGWLRGATLRGAVVLDAASGQRRDPRPERGVRVSRLDYAPSARAELEGELERNGLGHFRVREALAIASKVLWAGVVAELCWSDEPEYTTGYVATGARGYVRLTHFKPGDAAGGRVFFVPPGCQDTALAGLIERLERRAALIEGPVAIHPSVPGSDLS